MSVLRPSPGEILSINRKSVAITATPSSNSSTSSRWLKYLLLLQKERFVTGLPELFSSFLFSAGIRTKGGGDGDGDGIEGVGEFDVPAKFNGSELWFCN